MAIPNHDEKGRFAEGPGGPSSLAVKQHAHQSNPANHPNEVVDSKVAAHIEGMSVESHGPNGVGRHIDFGNLQSVDKGKATAFFKAQKSYNVTDKGIVYFKK